MKKPVASDLDRLLINVLTAGAITLLKQTILANSRSLFLSGNEITYNNQINCLIDNSTIS